MSTKSSLGGFRQAGFFFNKLFVTCLYHGIKSILSPKYNSISIWSSNSYTHTASFKKKLNCQLSNKMLINDSDNCSQFIKYRNSGSVRSAEQLRYSKLTIRALFALVNRNIK